ncbi:Gfo/Idh/MocA family protein [Halalkalibacter okhensis]|uniref:Oxidoreductase n=1 Tax=Halalkalibacter okhensis TaxID=333138 RepID=A0A0B0IGL2_9BACI|nr:Gfo/Idh/MocA family oxidoreductase [Halalkalibacter okhensis]KHF39209.1 oxidoreductase [Halalkalibacter okhensis]
MVRFAVIGTNWITERFIEAATSIEGFSLSAVYSRTEDRAKQFARKFNVEHVYTDLHEMASSKEFDAVYVASPNSLHASQAMLMMENGKHVLCEKPLASNTLEVEAMIQCAKKHSVVLMEALKTTLLPNFLTIKEHLHKIGTVRRYVASYCQYSSRYDRYKQGEILNAFKPEFSNGSLMDIGVYAVYPLVVLFGEPKSIHGQCYMLDSGVDGQGSLMLQYEEMDALITYSKITNSYIPSEIQGEKGSIIIDKINIPENVTIKYNDGSEENITVPQDQQSMYYEAKEFIELIERNAFESTVNSHRHSIITASILEKARRQMGVIYPADKKDE